MWCNLFNQKAAKKAAAATALAVGTAGFLTSLGFLFHYYGLESKDPLSHNDYNELYASIGGVVASIFTCTAGGVGYSMTSSNTNTNTNTNNSSPSSAPGLAPG